jgi:tungstate transport system ATP-binding protein
MGLAIEVSGVAKGYGELPVLRECSFSFEANRTYALLGVNGAGKSTLLRLVALLETPDQGEIGYLEDGRPLQPDLDLKRQITLVLPQIGVFNTTVFKNVAYGLKIRGFPNKEIKERVEGLLALVGLLDKKDHKATTLSSGQVRRLGLARGLVIEPEVLLLDEPTASLDPGNAAVIDAAIRELRDRRAATIIMATHDFSQARELADRILVMEHGQIREVDLGEQGFSAPPPVLPSNRL